jgi:ribosomal protein S27AE
VDDNELYEIEDDEAVEAYCVRCRDTVEIENPMPVWTRRGIPATRGECPNCGGTVFRMGRSAAHTRMTRPAAVQVAGNVRAKLSQNTAYINFADEDEALAQQIAADLQKAGIACWLHGQDESDDINWAGGVHPALTECARMVYVLSPASLTAGDVEQAWRFFRDKRKPIVIAQLSPTAPPDDIRRSPRFDFAGDYKSAFRQMVQALSG